MLTGIVAGCSSIIIGTGVLLLLFWDIVQLLATPFDEQAVAGFFLGHFFGGRGGFCRFMV